MDLEKIIKVGIIGFSEEKVDLFTKIFQHSRPHNRMYLIHADSDYKAIDMAIVNTDSSLGIQQYREFVKENPLTPVVTVGEKPPPHHISGMLLASRVLRVLDKALLPEDFEGNKRESIADSEELTKQQSVEKSPEPEAESLQKPVKIEAIPSQGENTTEQFSSNDVKDSLSERERHQPEVPRSRLIDKQEKTKQQNLPGGMSVNLFSATKVGVPIQRSEQTDELQVSDGLTLGSGIKLPLNVDKALQTENRVDSQSDILELEREPIFTNEQSETCLVLVVDDSKTMQKTLKHELDFNTVEMLVDYADNGEQALQMVERKHYDLIFLDVMMPGIDGYEVCTEIRKIPEMKKTPIIMLSAKVSPLDEVKGIISGCTAYLTKPIKHEEVQKMLDRIVLWLTKYSKVT